MKKNKMKKGLVFITLIVASIFGVKGQYANQQALYSDLPQAKYLNPGVFPEYDGYFSLPLLSGWGVTGTNSSFSWNDMFDNGNLNLLGLVPLLKDKNHLNSGLGFDVFALGFKSGKNFFSLNISPKIDVNLAYNKSVFDFLINGNGDYIGETVSLNGFGFDVSVYTEAGIGYTRKVNEKLNIGGRGKLLVGSINISGNFDGVSLYTDPDDYSLTASSSGFSVNTYGAIGFQDPSLFIFSYLNGFNFSSLGFGLDLGGEYQLNEKINLFASVVDFGFIRWEDPVSSSNFSNNGSSFTFDGIPFAELIDDESGGVSEGESSFFDELGDSLRADFKLEESHIGYTTRLKTRIYAGASYKVNDFFDGQGMIHGRVFNNKFYPMYMLAGNFHVKKWLTTKLTYSAANKTFDNIGAGMVLHLGAFQLYAMFDNVIGFRAVDYAQFLNGSFGMNFTFKGEDGKLKKAKAKKQKAEKKKEKLKKNKKLTDEEKKKEIEKQEKIINEQQKEVDKAEAKQEKGEEREQKVEEKKEDAKEKKEEKKEEAEEKKEEAKIKAEEKEVKSEVKELKVEQKQFEQELKELKQETKEIKEPLIITPSQIMEKESSLIKTSVIDSLPNDSLILEPNIKSDSLTVPASIQAVDSVSSEFKPDRLMQKKEPLINRSDSTKNIIQE